MQGSSSQAGRGTASASPLTHNMTATTHEWNAEFITAVGPHLGVAQNALFALQLWLRNRLLAKNHQMAVAA